jgi:3-oxoacyl-[acyl-carrier protein] reductase
LTHVDQSTVRELNRSVAGAMFDGPLARRRLVTAMLARDPGPRGITINNVQPGPTDTDMNPDSGEFATQARGYTAVKRYA